MKRHRFALALLLLASSTSALSDTLVTNANGIQVDASGKLEHFTGILFDRDGKVVKLLHGEKLKLKDTQVIDAGGRTILPGLIDAHGHVMSLGFGALQLELTGTTSLADLRQRLRAYAAANPDAKWIIGRGWNQELWADKRFPTSADLDSVVSGRPVWLARVDGHAGVANSAALKVAGVNAGTKAPPGGRIENGLFVDAAQELIEARIPAPSKAEYDAAFEKSQQLMLAVGLTGAADMGTSLDDWGAFRRSGEAGKLKLRVLSYSSTLGPIKKISPSGPTAWMFDDRLRMAGVKLYADGALGSRGAWLKAPYHDMPSTSGLSLISRAQLDRQVDDAASHGLQLAIHAIGDAANDEVISAFEKAGAKFGRDRRWRIEHLQIIDPTDLPRLKPAGIIASMQPTHQTSDRLMAEARLGPDRLEGAYAWQTIARLGVPLAFGSDFPVESPNPFHGIAAAISRQGLDGQPPGGWRPQERVSFEQALAGFTRGAAYAAFAEDRIGSLDPGHRADFLVIDRDISTASATEIAGTQVLQIFVGGKEVTAKAGPPAR